jgi:hypothetical protein
MLVAIDDTVVAIVIVAIVDNIVPAARDRVIKASGSRNRVAVLVAGIVVYNSRHCCKCRAIMQKVLLWTIYCRCW